MNFGNTNVETTTKVTGNGGFWPGEENDFCANYHVASNYFTCSET